MRVVGCVEHGGSIHEVVGNLVQTLIGVFVWDIAASQRTFLCLGPQKEGVVGADFDTRGLSDSFGIVHPE